MKRILCLISCMNAGGAETFLMKLYRQMDKSQYQLDFCINVKEKCFYEDEILSMGGRIFRIPSKSENRKEFARQLTQVIQKEGYASVLRITSNAMGFMDLKIAKKAGAKICAARSSNSSDGKGWKPWLAHRMGKLLYGKYVDVKFAPSDLAAIYTFGQKAYDQGKVTILHNAVDLDVFSYSDEGRTAIRQELGVDEATVLVGHVGRFDPQKNHGQLLDIYAEIAKKQPQSKLLLVGQGKLQDQTREKAKALGIADRVIFAGVRSDIPRVLSAMDVFVFPSLYEGMPNTRPRLRVCPVSLPIPSPGRQTLQALCSTCPWKPLPGSGQTVRWRLQSSPAVIPTVILSGINMTFKALLTNLCPFAPTLWRVCKV